MKRCRSLQRAIKRGHQVSFLRHAIADKRPFNNRRNTSKRKGVNSRNHE
jgi:hypothetical protein